MRPSSIASPGALLRYRIGPADPDQGTDSPPPVDCCETDEDDIPDRTYERVPLSLGATTGVDTEDVNETDGTLTDGGGSRPWVNPTNANDGNSATWAAVESFAGAGIEYNAYLDSDLGAAVLVTEMSLDADANGNSDHDIGTFFFYWSDDGVSWTLEPASVTSQTPVVLTRTISTWEFDGGPVSHRYWRLRWTYTSGGFITGVFLYSWLINAGTTASMGWVVPEANVTDGDDATYSDTEGDTWDGEHLRFDLGAEYRIVRTRIRLGTTSAGAKTLTLYGFNESDASDIVEVTTIDFTGTGSLTAQDIEATWYTDTAYRYWQIDGPSEVIRWYSVEFYEPTIAQSHQHDPPDAADIPYDNGTSGLTADDLQEAIDELTGLIGTGDFVTVTDGGGEVISTVAASGAAETVDLADGNVHDITLTADCTFTFAAVDGTRARSFTLFLREDGTGGHANDTTWPGSVVWAGGTPPDLDDTAGAVNVLTFVTLDGGTVWYGFTAGGGGSAGTPATTVEAETTFGLSPAVGTDTEYARQDHTHGTPADPGGGEDTSLSEVVGAGSTETIDCSVARVHHVLLDDDCTVTLDGPVPAEAHRLTILLQQDDTGGWEVTWPAEVLWPGGITPTLTTDPEHTDWIDLLTVDNGATWLGVMNAADYATSYTPPVGPSGTFPLVWLSNNL